MKVSSRSDYHPDKGVISNILGPWQAPKTEAFVFGGNIYIGTTTVSINILHPYISRKS